MHICSSGHCTPCIVRSNNKSVVILTISTILKIIPIIIIVSKQTELENTIRIEGPRNPLLAGGSYFITCVITADLLPEVKWRDGDGHDIPYEDEESGNGVYVDKEVVTGHTTRLTLQFTSLLTSQGGSYACLSIISTPSSIQVGGRDVIVKSESIKFILLGGYLSITYHKG